MWIPVSYTHLDVYKRQAVSKVKEDGAARGNIYGTYVHGVFDKEEVAVRIIEGLAAAKGISMDEITAVDYQAFKESQYDILASELRRHLDIEKIYQIMEEGV